MADILVLQKIRILYGSQFLEKLMLISAAAQTQAKIEDDSDDLADCNTCPRDAEGNAVSTVKEEWKKLFGGKVVGSNYMDILFIRL